MAPTKNTRAVTKQTSNASIASLLPITRKGPARKPVLTMHDQNVDIIQTRAKRKADNSPINNDKNVKRSALGNLTNNVQTAMTMPSTQHHGDDAKSKQQQFYKKKDNQQYIATTTNVLKDTQNISNNHNKLPTNKILTRAATRNAVSSTINNLENKIFQQTTTNLILNKPVPEETIVLKIDNKIVAAQQPKPPPAAPVSTTQPLVIKVQKTVRRISNEFNKTEDSLYMSALEDVSSSESMRLSGNFEASKRRSMLLQQQEQIDIKIETAIRNNDIVKKSIPDDVEDFDKLNWNDPFQVSNYAMDIFEYLKQRETEFIISDYMERQIHLSKWMRSLLVDWMVEVQETFELNHETLYLAVKIIDLYLSRVVINKDKLQLLGAAALFIACKFDERTPPLVEDFLYICDGAYQHDELIKMEINTLRTIDYDLGIPLSYRFLRRYARCAKISMPILTLARYVLELSLMDYAIVSLSDSKLAAAALFIALRMDGIAEPWTTTLQYYTGYKLSDIADIIPILNAGLHRKQKCTVKTIRSKYSHKIFHEVAKITLLTTKQLFEQNIVVNSIQHSKLRNIT